VESLLGHDECFHRTGSPSRFARLYHYLEFGVGDSLGNRLFRAVKGLRAVAAMNCSSVALKKFLLRSHSAGKVLDSIVRCCFGC